MKKIALAIALIASIVMPTQAQAAQTGFTGGPLTNLDPASASIHIALSNFPKDGGLIFKSALSLLQVADQLYVIARSSCGSQHLWAHLFCQQVT